MVGLNDSINDNIFDTIKSCLFSSLFNSNCLKYFKIITEICVKVFSNKFILSIVLLINDLILFLS